MVAMAPPFQVSSLLQCTRWMTPKWLRYEHQQPHCCHPGSMPKRAPTTCPSPSINSTFVHYPFSTWENMFFRPDFANDVVIAIHGPPIPHPASWLHPAHPICRATTIGSPPPFSISGNPIVLSISPPDPVLIHNSVANAYHVEPVLQSVPSACRCMAYDVLATGQHDAMPYMPA